MTRLSHKRTLLTALLSGTLAFSPVLSTAQYAFADTPIHAMASDGKAYTETDLVEALELGTTTSVTLGSDIVCGAIYVSHSATLDLNGYTLTLTNASRGIVVSSGTLTVKNGTITNDSGICLSTEGSGKVVINSGKYISGSGYKPLAGIKENIKVHGGMFSTSIDSIADIESGKEYLDGTNGYYYIDSREFEYDLPTKVTLDETSFVYDGTIHRPKVVSMSPEPATYETRDASGIDVGTYFSLVTGKTGTTNYAGGASFEITPRAITVAPTSETIDSISEDYYKSYTGKVTVKSGSLASGHTIEGVVTPDTSRSSESWVSATIPLKLDSVTVKDANGKDVTKNYRITKEDGTLTVTDYSSLLSLFDYDWDYDYIDYTDLYLSNATVTLTADPAPYKSSGYRDRDNIKSVVVNGIDVTSRCEYSYSGDADPGSTVTVTITPSNSFYNNTSTSRSAATPSNSSSTTSAKSQSISAASEEGVPLSAMTENEEQIAIVANELPEIVAQAYYSGLYPSGSEYYDMLYWLMNNSGANSSYYTDLSRYLYGNYGILNLGNYIGTNGNTSLLNLINRYYRGGYYGNWYNGYYNRGYYNNGNFFDYNNRTYRLTGSKTVTFKISDSNSTVTVSANNVTKRQGDPDPVLTATILGVNESDKSKINYTISRVQGETPGTYAINVTGATEQNGYKVTFVPGTLTITAATAGTDVAGGAITAGTGTTATTPAVLPTSPATVAATTSANKLAATGDNTFLGYGVLALVGVAVVALGVFFNHRKKDGE